MVGFARVIGVLAIQVTLLFFATSSSFAYELEGEPGYFDPLHPPAQALKKTPPPAPGSTNRIYKFDLALKELGIPEESAPSFLSFPPSGSVSWESVQEHLFALDPDGALRAYLDLNPNGLSLFRDLFSSGIPSSLLEFFFPFQRPSHSRLTSESFGSANLLHRLKRVGAQVKESIYEYPLSGLRVVIDPGHMGSEEWDRFTGKFVSVGGKTISEGDLARSTALLLAGELEELGAEIILTRIRNEPVAKTRPDTFDPAPFRNQYFYNSFDSWMNGYFRLPENRFVSAVRNAPETARAYSPSQLTQFFTSGEDLEARARIVDEAQADVVIDVHFDASRSYELQNGDGSIEAFVPGGVRLGETGSRVVRSHHLKHLLEVSRWKESVNLASAMIQSMSRSLQLPLLSRPEFLTAVKVKDGVYARNLYINRRNLSSLMVYLECLHYDHVREFPKLALKDRTGSYRGETFSYPHRLDAVVKGAREGILRYFQEMP
jgi:N-acetylmuramoyl-L-alanine amidase